jgi:predicted esterase
VQRFFYITATVKTPKQSSPLPFAKVLILLLISWCGMGITVACTLKERGKTEMIAERDSYKRGRLRARPDSKKLSNAIATGVQPLNLDSKRDGFIYVPANYTPDRPASLALMLHGAGGQAQHGLSLLSQYADAHNIILLAPASRAETWDIIASDSFGTDVRFIDQALALVFKHYAVDASHIAIGGFSDGASYALCLGLSNGDLFTHILAFSPGFVFTIENKGKPAVFISHGTKDQVLPIGPCSRRIVPQLQQLGLQVNYQEFDGEHQIPDSISKNGVEWFTKK